MQILVSILVALLFLLGLVGTVVPYLPGTALILAGALVYALSTGFEPVGPGRLLILCGLTALSFLLDYLAGILGARKWGGSGWATGGAVVGTLVGLFFGLPGLLLGPLVGAVLGELVHRRRLDASLRAAAGVMIGILLGAVAKVGIALVMVGLFLWWVLTS